MGLPADLDSCWCLIRYAHDQKPQSQPKFRNESKRIAHEGDCVEGGEKEELKRGHQPRGAMNHSPHAQNPGEEARLEDRITQWKEPGAIKYLGDHEPIFV